MFKEQPLYPFITAVSQSIRDSLLMKPELERIYNNTYLELEHKNKDISQLEMDIAEIQSVLKLKQKIYLAIRI